MTVNSGKQKSVTTRDFDANLLPHIRRSRNLSQQRFAELAGIQRQALTAIENGRTELTPYYRERLQSALRRVRFSSWEMEKLIQLRDYRTRRGYTAT